MQFIIFGAGSIGRELLHHLGYGKVSYFCDNDPKKVGMLIDGVEVISYIKLLRIYKDYTIIISTCSYYIAQIRIQLENDKIFNYILYEEDCKKKKKFAEDNRYDGREDLRIPEINPMKNYMDFRNYVKEFKIKTEDKFNSSHNESFYYGYGKALMDYAGIDEDYEKFPIVSHNAGFASPNEHIPLFNCSIATTVFAKTYKMLHNLKFPYVPIFAVGPYIQYAQSIYQKTTIENLKKNFKKIGLVFLSHSIESMGVSYDEKKIVKHLIENHTKVYDKIVVCAYWHDVDREIYDILQKSGIEVVSAGFRWDDMFIRRLRTLFEIADDVIFYGYTTAVIFALSMRKKIKFYNVDERFDMPECNRLDVRFKYFTKEEDISTWMVFDEKDLEHIEIWNRKYGLDIMLSPEEMRLIYEVCCDIWENCDYNVREYPVGVYRTYLKYQKEYNFDKLTCLSNAIGQGAICS